MSALYYESHVTIEPVFDARRDEASVIAKRHGFKLAELLMKKRSIDDEKRSDKVTFMTGHAQHADALLQRMRLLVGDLQSSGFLVWRYKIEECIVDSRVRDSEGLFA